MAKVKVTNDGDVDVSSTKPKSPDPYEVQQSVEVVNIKAMGELTTQLVASFNSITVGASQNFMATMDAMNKSMLANLDFSNKVLAKQLELDPTEAASAAAILQQAIKAAQTTSPETGTKSN